MAYSADKYEEKEEAKVEFNNGNSIIVKSVVTKDSGAVAVDIRRNYTDDNGEVKPTSKGIRINSDNIGDIIVGVYKALPIEALYDIQGELEKVIEKKEKEMEA